jgi:hypothetical protein
MRVGNEVAGVLRARGTRKRNRGGREDSEVKKGSAPAQGKALFMEVKAPNPSCNSVTTANDTSVENELQLEISETAMPSGRRPSIAPQVRFSGVGCKANLEDFCAPRGKRGGIGGLSPPR